MCGRCAVFGERLSYGCRIVVVVLGHWKAQADASMLSPTRIDMNHEMKIDAAIVRRLRESHAWSQEQLAAVAGISARTVQRVEGEGSASADTCMALAIAFGCLPADLMKPEPVEIGDMAPPNGTRSEAHTPTRHHEAWTAARMNAVVCLLTTTGVWVGILLGNALIGPSGRMFGLPMYDPFVFSLTVILFVSILTTPGAMKWAAERWGWPSNSGASCDRRAASITRN
jgi:transcriptional regulator with XRE-family HTH domain